MKRLIAVPVLFCALAVPAAADAGLDASAAEPVSSKGTKPFKINFDVFKQGGDPVGVDNFNVKRLKIDCDEGPFLLNFTLNLPGQDFFPVNGAGKFNALGSSASSEGRIKGTFVNNNKVKGKVRAEGDFAGPPSEPNLNNCLGSRRYTAN
jgi:hypothetical protein